MPYQNEFAMLASADVNLTGMFAFARVWICLGRVVILERGIGLARLYGAEGMKRSMAEIGFCSSYAEKEPLPAEPTLDVGLFSGFFNVPIKGSVTAHQSHVSEVL